MEEIVFVTEDKWMIEAGGLLDRVDRQLLCEAAQGGKFRVRVVNIKGMLEAMRDEEPEKFQEYKRGIERQAGSLMTLSFEQCVELSRKGNETLDKFEGIVASMDLGQATQIRHWRVDVCRTWRSVARSAYNSSLFSRAWNPPANQIMGMALCNRAAQVYGEDYRKGPWN